MTTSPSSDAHTPSSARDMRPLLERIDPREPRTDHGERCESPARRTRTSIPQMLPPFIRCGGRDRTIIYFDDQHGHVDSARQHVAAGHVPFGVANIR